jgi:hypothetical protein
MDIFKLAYTIVQQSIGEEPIKNDRPTCGQRGLKRAVALTGERSTVSSGAISYVGDFPDTVLRP